LPDQTAQKDDGSITRIKGDGNVIGNNTRVTIIKETKISPPAIKPKIPLQKPLRVPHFIGREKELEDLLRYLQPGRAITICGPGGMGKTALTAEAVWQLAPDNAPPDASRMA